MQVIALFILLLSALVMERFVTLDSLLGRTEKTSELSMETRHFTHGVAPILLASFISGLAGALSQKNLQGTGGRNPYLFSMELCAVSVIILAFSMLVGPDGKMIRENGFWSGWTPWTMIPILTNSIGGIIVGLVTKYAGSVQKGFALIFGIFISGLLQAPDTGVSREQILGGTLAAISLWLHATFPAATAATKATKQD
jgi:UDP-sugar transporter A1/2/3